MRKGRGIVAAALLFCFLTVFPVRAEGGLGDLFLQEDGSYRYLREGIWQEDFVGFCQNDKGEDAYIVGGVWQSQKTGYVKRESDEKWVFLRNGVIISDFYGVIKTSPGVQAYLTAGVWDRGLSGLQPSTEDGKILYVKKGLWQEGFNGFVTNAQGQSCYVLGGVWQSQKTGYVKRESDGKWVFLRRGVIISDFYGVIKTTPGVQAYLTAGVWDRGVSGLQPSTKDGKILYVKKGIWQEDFTGFVTNAQGQSCYVKKGVWQSSLTGLVKRSSDEQYVYVAQGVLNKAYSGLYTQGSGKVVYLTKGVWDKTLTGLRTLEDGRRVYIKKGVFQSSFTGVYKDDTAVRHYIQDGVRSTAFTGLVSQGSSVYQVSAGQVSSPQKHALQVPEKRKVILITIDGMRPDGFRKCGNAYVKQILKESRYSLTGRTVYPSYTLPAHYSLFHGTDPERHGIKENYYKKPQESVMGLVEHLRGNGRHCAMYYSWETLKYIANAKALKASGFIDGTAGPSVNADERLTQMALDYIQESKPDFVFLYLLDTDEWGGHPYGWMSREYLARLSKALDCVKRVQEAAGQEYTILLTSDHGGHGKNHGTDKAEDMTIPLFALGPDFAGGSQFGSFSILDIAPTVSALMGLAPDKGWSGKSLLP